MDEHQSDKEYNKGVWLLHIYSIMGELGDMEGFRIGGTVVNNLKYADDTVIVAELEEQL